MKINELDIVDLDSICYHLDEWIVNVTQTSMEKALQEHLYWFPHLWTKQNTTLYRGYGFSSKALNALKSRKNGVIKLRPRKFTSWTTSEEVAFKVAKENWPKENCIVCQTSKVKAFDVQRFASLVAKRVRTIEKEVGAQERSGYYSPAYVDYVKSVPSTVANLVKSAKNFSHEQEMLVIGNGIKQVSARDLTPATKKRLGIK